MKADIEDDRAAIDALKAALAERAWIDLPWRPEVDHRLTLYRTPSGALMCLARTGGLVSETPVTVARCGVEAGCDGAWRCLSIDEIAGDPGEAVAGTRFY